MQIRTYINRSNYEKYFGQFYNMGAIIFSWIFFFFLKGRMVASANSVIFTPEKTRPDTATASVIIIAVIFELAGTLVKIRRIRHIKTHPEEYGEFYKPSSSDYVTDLIFFHFMTMFITRIILNALLGYIVFALLGFGELAALGSLLFIFKDILLIFLGPKNLHKPLNRRVSKTFNALSNIMLLFSGFIFLSIGWETFGQKFNEVLCTIRNWQGLGDFIIGILVLTLFYFILFYPTRLAYQLEEIEFTDSGQEEKRLLKYYLNSIIFAIIPWLI